MDMVNIIGLTNRNIKEIGKTIILMDLENTNGMMVVNMLAIGNTI